jgi:2-dehydropantoate 2-reductase
MRVCVYGAGATGGNFAVRLARAGNHVSVIARGPNLDAIRVNGLVLLEGKNRLHATVDASDDPAVFGPQDLVLVTAKATALGSVGERIGPLLDCRTHVVFAQNGMPWWYPQGLPAHLPTPPDVPIFQLASVFLERMRVARVLGALIYSANEAERPGVVRNTSPGANRLDLAAISGGDTPDVTAVRDTLAAAGIASPAVRDIRASVWRKLVINMSGSTLALVTGNRSSISRSDPMLGEIYLRVAREGLAISAAHGYPLDDVFDPEAMRNHLNDHKPSLLQDFERGRPLEIAEIVLAPVAFARAAAVSTPTLETIAAIVRRLAMDRGLYVP